MLTSLVNGYTMVLFTTPDMDEILNAVERYDASGFYGVPTLYEYLKEYDKTDRVDWKRIKVIVCGADTLHESTVEGWERRTGSHITEGYGMTETAAVSHTNPLAPAQAGLLRAYPSPTSAPPSWRWTARSSCPWAKWGRWCSAGPTSCGDTGGGPRTTRRP